MERREKLIPNGSEEFEMIANAMEDGHSNRETTFILNEYMYVTIYLRMTPRSLIWVQTVGYWTQIYIQIEFHITNALEKMLITL